MASADFLAELALIVQANNTAYNASETSALGIVTNTLSVRMGNKPTIVRKQGLTYFVMSTDGVMIQTEISSG